MCRLYMDYSSCTLSRKSFVEEENIFNMLTASNKDLSHLTPRRACLCLHRPRVELLKEGWVLKGEKSNYSGCVGIKV